MPPPYEIIPYSIDNLKAFLTKKFPDHLEIVHNKLHITYFQEYFRWIKAKTIIVENEYIDRDYLDDFMTFYVNCFGKYEKCCSRLHFFDVDFSLSDFDQFLQGQSTEIDYDKLGSAYLGFMVIKPLPLTVIGRTCLKTYDTDGGRRNYSVVRDYEVNLFGISLKIKSLAFQEQDHVVSACATSALWSVFHGTGITFQHPILSPADITRVACDNYPMDTRYIPNNGLMAPQMAQAIRKVELEPFLVKPSRVESLKATLYGYLKGEIPVLLGVLLIDGSKSPGTFEGKHAVAVTGYSLGKPLQPFPGHGFILKASQIDRIYAHDDQVGPFSRIILDMKDIQYTIDGVTYSRSSMHTSWVGKNEKIGSIRAIPELLLIPLYHKIRIPFESVHDAVMFFDNFIETIRTSTGSLSLKERIVWDIYLTTNNKIKEEIFKSVTVHASLKKEVLEKHMARYLWRATATCSGNMVLDLLFDATDIEQAYYVQYAIGYHQNVFNEIKAIANACTGILPKTNPIWKVLHYFTKP